jgi:hypothetical protein
VPVVKRRDILFADYPKRLCLGATWHPYKGCPVDDGGDCDYQESFNGFTALYNKCTYSATAKFDLVASSSKNYQWHDVFAYPGSVMLSNVDISSAKSLSTDIMDSHDPDKIKSAFNMIVKIAHPQLNASGINLFFPSPRFFANSDSIDIKTIGVTSGGPGDDEEAERERLEREAKEKLRREEEERARQEAEAERLRQLQGTGGYTSAFKEKLSEVTQKLSTANDSPQADQKATELFAQITDVLKHESFSVNQLTDLDKSIVVFTFILQNLTSILQWVNGDSGEVATIVKSLDTGLATVVTEVVTATR